MKTRDQVEKELESNIPREVIGERSAGMGRTLSYLASWYVIDRLNKVFGNLGWDSETVDMKLITENPARYVSKVRITVSVPALSSDGELIGYTKVTKEGTGWGSDKPRKDGSVESPHEMAVKEAESDALKRAAMKLGISMGLGLYDKSGEFIDEKVPEKVLPTLKVTNAELTVATPGINRKALNDKIGAMSRVVIAKKLKTVDELKSLIKEKYSVSSKEELTDEQAKELNNVLESLANGN